MQEQITFMSHGLKIASILHLPDKAGKFPGVIFSHGYMSGKDGSKANYLGEWAEKNGVAFLRFDYSGIGESEGEKEDLTISNRIKELRSAVDFLSNHKNVSDKIIVIGSSFGGLTSLLEAIKDDRVSALIEIAPLTMLNAEEFRKSNAKWGIKMRQDFYIDLATYRLHPMLEQIKQPVYIFHGEQDVVVPISQSKKSVKHLQHSVLVPLPDADHYFKDEQVFADLMKRVTEKIKEIINS